MSARGQDVPLTVVAELLDTTVSALRAFLWDTVSAADRGRWTFVEGLSVKKLPRNEWRVRFRSCWFEGEYLAIWLNFTTFAARVGTAREGASLRTKVNRRSRSIGGCDEARVDGRRFRMFAGRWKVLVALVVDLGSIDTCARRSPDKASTRAPPDPGEASPGAPSFLDTFAISRRRQPRSARRTA